MLVICTHYALFKVDIIRPFSIAGDLLREEQNREGSGFGAIIRQHIRDGTIAPIGVTVRLLENAIRTQLARPHPGAGWDGGHGQFLVDGFPRKMDHGIRFDETVSLLLSSLVGVMWY